MLCRSWCPVEVSLSDSNFQSVLLTGFHALASFTKEEKPGALVQSLSELRKQKEHRRAKHIRTLQQQIADYKKIVTATSHPPTIVFPQDRRQEDEELQQGGEKEARPGLFRLHSSPAVLPVPQLVLHNASPPSSPTAIGDAWQIPSRPMNERGSERPGTGFYLTLPRKQRRIQ